MKNKLNIVPLGKIGEVVYYNGIVDYTDYFTMSLMWDNLDFCKSYTIREIFDNYRDEFGKVYCYHYRFSEISTKHYWYPCNSFTCDIRKILMKKYNLK